MGQELYKEDLDIDEEKDALRMVTCLADVPTVRTQQVRDKISSHNCIFFLLHLISSLDAISFVLGELENPATKILSRLW